MGSIARRLRILWLWRALGIVAVIVMLFNYREENIINEAAFNIAVLSLVIILVYTFRYIMDFRLAIRIESAFAFIEEVACSDRLEYCLLIRPFGADGFVPLLVAESERKDLLGWAKKPVQMSNTLETVIKSCVAESIHCNTVALVDPRRRMLPRQPRYISAPDGAWRGVVDVLVRRALLVCVILPPDVRNSQALEWEVDHAVRNGLVGRLLIVLPPPETEGYDQAYRSLLALSSVFPEVESLKPNVAIVYPEPYGGLRYYCCKSGKDEAVGEGFYRDCLLELMVEVSSHLGSRSFVQRYPYWDPKSKVFNLRFQ